MIDDKMAVNTIKAYCDGRRKEMRGLRRIQGVLPGE